MRALGALAVALVVSGCGGNFVWVENGGVAVSKGSCSDAALTGDLEVVVPNAPGCERRAGFLLPPHAAAAFWQAREPIWAGPVIAPSAAVKVAVTHPLTNGDGDKGLVSGTSDKGLVSGSGDTGLASGTGDKGLVSGSSSKGLVSGTGDKGLGRGAGNQGLTSGTGARGLTSGTGEVAPLTLSKRGVGTARPDHAASFELVATNTSDVPLSRVAVVDRVDPALRVEARGATTTTLADGSTVVVFRSDAPLEGHASRKFVISVFAR